jgi:hypothetical protein
VLAGPGGSRVAHRAGVDEHPGQGAVSVPDPPGNEPIPATTASPVSESDQNDIN